MNPSDYIADLQRLLQSNPHIFWHHLETEFRGESFLYLFGSVEFLQGTTLDFKEFLEFLPSQIDKYMYAYNYRLRETVIFRYDNAPDPRAKHLPSYPAHKHEGQVVLASPSVDLPFVITEILRHISESPRG